MKARRVFRFIWRVNAITILVVTLLCIFSLVVVLWDLTGGPFRAPVERDAVEVAEQLIDPEEFTLGTFEAVDGTSVLRAELYSTQNYGGKFSSDSSFATRNFLFYDYDQRAAHWLASDNERIFPWHAEIASPERPANNREVTAHLYQVVASDTNGDSRLTALDKSKLAISDPAGLHYVTLLPDVGVHKGYANIGNGKALFFYERDGALRVAEIDVVRRTLVDDRELSSAPDLAEP